MGVYRKEGWLSIQILGYRLFEYSGFPSAKAIYIFNRAVAFYRLGRWEIGNLQKGILK